MTKTSKPIQLTVPQWIEIQIEASGKTQAEIARECGWPKPNIITMIKQGKTKMPYGKVGLMARSLGVSSLEFLRRVMSEYDPAAWEGIEDALNSNRPDILMTDEERMVLNAMRKRKKALTPEEVAKVTAFIGDVK